MSWYTLSVQSISNSSLRIHFQRPKFFYFLFTLFEVFSRTLSDTPVIFPSVFSLNVCKTILLSDNCFCRHGYCSYLLRYWDFFANIHYDIQSLPRKQKCAVDYSVIGWHLLVDTSMGQRTEATIAHTQSGGEIRCPWSWRMTRNQLYLIAGLLSLCRHWLTLRMYETSPEMWQTNGCLILLISRFVCVLYCLCVPSILKDAVRWPIWRHDRASCSYSLAWHVCSYYFYTQVFNIL